MYRIVFSPEAREQARATARWWLPNRPLAPRLFASELRAALTLLARAPGLGVSYKHAELAGVRRVLLSRTGTHVYFLADEANSIIEILAIWGAVREHGPDL